MFREVKKSSWKTSVQLLFVVVAAFMLWGCDGGGSSYDTPTETNSAAVGGSATNVLIESATLKSWMDDGLVGNETGYGEKVVILDFRSPADSDRISGACRLEGADLTATRFEGVANAAPLVATGAQMDSAIQRLGIDEDTTIVFSTGGSAYLATRAYWTFRYWGFPKEQLKLLNGGNAAFAAEYPGHMTAADDAPTPTPSTYSVRNLDSINDDLRASISELIEIIKTDLTTSTTDIVFDARGDSYYLGTNATSGLLSGGKVVFDGHPEGGQFLSQSELFDAGKFKTAAEIEALFTAKGWDAGKKVTVYCTSGYSATPLFFAIDAILDADVQLHDGSWSQTGKYSDYADAGGLLPLNSPWAIDQYMDPATLTYNLFNITDPSVPSSITFLQLAVGDVPQPTPFTGSNPVNDLDTVQSQIEAADEAAALAGVSPFTDPDTTSTPTALIDADTLMAWEDLVNAPLDGNERVVIVDITSEAGYAAGHIPGAVYWSSGDRAENRFEGPIDGYNMVLGAEKFQSLLDVAGIDENTTIVLTTSSSVSYYPSRLYFTLRYWGVPKNRLKVLNGHNAAWPAAMLTTDVPTIADAGSLTVAELMTNTQVRASLSEMMDAARDRRGTPVDFRGDSTAAGSTGGAVFNGNINNGRYMDRYPYFDDEGLWLSRGEMISLMAEYDIVVSDFSTDESFSYPALPYCTKGNLGAYGYFLYDAILNVDTMLYDGSWSQWGALSDNVDNGGELSASENSGGYALEAWAVDNATYMEEVNYGLDALGDLDAFDTDPTALTLDPADTAANQIENIDFDYQIQAPTSPDSETAPPTEGDGDLGGGC